MLLDIFDFLGFIRNEAKSDQVPSQRFVFLGILYDMLLALAMIPQDRWMKITSSARRCFDKIKLRREVGASS
jgi:hypothetical protein